MRSIVPIFPAILAAVFATTSGWAYLSPNEVFTDLEIPAAGGSAGQEDWQYQNPFETDGTVTPAPVSAPDETQNAEEPAAQQEPEVREEEFAPPPTFYRSGETIKTEEKSPPPPPPVEQNIFAEPEPAAPAEPLPVEPAQDTPEEMPAEGAESSENGDAPTDEEQAGEETAKQSAPKSSLVMRLMDRLKYLIAAVGLGIGGLAFVLGKKKMTPAKTQAQPVEQAAVQPGNPGPQAVEESSKRLEHALSAMSGTPEAPAPQTPPTEGAKQ